MNYKVLLIKNLTNMHVGSGDNQFGVIDNLVQRDPVTHFPTIFSSSLKGAMREFFQNEPQASFLSTSKEDLIEYVFGIEKEVAQKRVSKPGAYRFFAANLLALPVRSNKKSFFMATTPSLLNDFFSTLSNFGITETFDDIKKLSEINADDKKILINDQSGIKIESWESLQDQNIPENNNYIGNNVAIFSEDNFKELTKCLPVIARNHLDNGKSTNLWYEEIVPRETRFYCIVGESDQYSQTFEDIIGNGTIQIGGNASIGYGFTKIQFMGGK